MDWPNPNIKSDPKARWAQPDNVFFAQGACHILAGIFLEDRPLSGFYGEWITPNAGFHGTHVIVSDGQLAFDHNGFTPRDRLLARYWADWQSRFDGWDATIERVNFSLLDTTALNARNHRGPDQYFGDVIARARVFIGRHVSAHLLGSRR